MGNVGLKVMLINPPYQTLTCNLGVGHQVPLGLLMIGGALRDAGLDVQLLDAEALHMSSRRIVQKVKGLGAHVVMTGHAGSTSAHPVCMKMLAAIKRECPTVTTVYGGVFPTYHVNTILSSESAVDVIVRGEGEATAVALAEALPAVRTGHPVDLRAVEGIAFRDEHAVIQTKVRPPIDDLDAHRTAWELIEDWDRYQCFGLGRASIVQFSRGCPHRCTYCGQHDFWVKWRHRDPAKVADEIAWLNRRHDVRFVSLADENPTTSRSLWRRFLEQMARRNVDVHFYASIRASDIVRDADILDLYRAAGILYVLIGIDSINPEVIDAIRKRSTTRLDYEACQLLKRHGIRSIVGHIVGFEAETWRDFRRALLVHAGYDVDLLNVMYATPHSWTRFAQDSAHRLMVQADQRCWDYRHQVLRHERLKPWQLFAAVKWLEFAFHMRPGRLACLFRERDPFLRRQLWWTTLYTGVVWLAEIAEFLFSTRFTKRPQRLSVCLEHANSYGRMMIRSPANGESRFNATAADC